jgi:hypothetical protein
LGEISLTQGDPTAAEQNLRRALDFGGDSAAIQLPLLKALLVQANFSEIRGAGSCSRDPPQRRHAIMLRSGLLTASE